MTNAEASEFVELYSTHFHRIALQLYAYLGDQAEAQDAAQEAFCRAYDRWSTVGAYEDALAWVRRVAWNLATSRLRHLQIIARHVVRQRVEHVQGPDPDRIAVVRALAVLPGKQRLAVVLYYFGRLSVAEIAEQERVPEGTVKSWLSRGRARLAEYFTDTHAPELEGALSFQPPGADAVATTVRRRRIARRSALAAVLALVVAIPVAIMMLGRPSGPTIIGPTPAPSVTPSPSPMPSPGTVITRKLGIQGVSTSGLMFADRNTGWLHHDSCDRMEMKERTPQCRHRLWHTADAGVTWREVSLPALPHEDFLIFFPGEASTLSIVLNANSGQVRGYLVTRDGGRSFSPLQPPEQPPAAALLSRGGLYQTLCPGSSGFGPDAEFESCPQRQLVKVGTGLISPAVGQARATTSPDGRVWLVDKEEIKVSSDDGATWQQVPRPPVEPIFDDWTPKFSPDGSEIWLRRANKLYRLDGDHWSEQPGYLSGLTETSYWAADYAWAPLGGGLLAMRDQGRLAFVSADGTVSAFTGVAGDFVKLLADGTLWTGDDRGNQALGVGTGADRAWTVFSD